MNGIKNDLSVPFDGIKSGLKRILFLSPIPIVLGFLCVKVGWSRVYLNIIQEDSFLEYGQFFAYGGASLFVLIAGLGCLKKGFHWNGCIFLLLAVVLAMASLEEISWGQRIFKIDTPAFFQQHNTQEEINVHNLRRVQHVLNRLYVLVGSLFSLGWIPAKLVSSIRGLKVQETGSNHSIPKLLKDDIKTAIRLFGPKWYLMLFFLPVTLVYLYFILSKSIGQPGHFIIWRDQEPVELLLALGFLLYAAAGMIQTKHIANRKNA